MDPERLWMYEGWARQGEFTNEWQEKAEQFVDRVFADPIRPAKVLCPCAQCCNAK